MVVTAEVSPIVKWSLFFFNLLVKLVGIVTLALGIYGRLLQNDFDEVANLSTDPALILIIAGSVCTFIGACGVVGALRENVLLLKMYYFSVGVIILVEISAVVVAFVFQEELRDSAARKMLEGVRLYRTTNQQTNLDDAVESVQRLLSCCGAHSPRDWLDNNLYHNCTRETFTRVLSACGVPSSCCSSNGATNSQCGYKVYSYPEMPQSEQDMYPTITMRSTLIYTKGCNKALYDWITSNYARIGGAAAGVILLQLITIFLAVSLKDSIEAILFQAGLSATPIDNRYA